MQIASWDFFLRGLSLPQRPCNTRKGGGMPCSIWGRKEMGPAEHRGSVEKGPVTRWARETRRAGVTWSQYPCSTESGGWGAVNEVESEVLCAGNVEEEVGRCGLEQGKVTLKNLHLDFFTLTVSIPCILMY